MTVSAAPVWTAEAFLAATGGQLDGPAPGDIAAISMDSRTIGVGEAFFAIRGDRLDGHRFVADALKRGAALAVVASSFERGSAPGALLRVADPLGAMRRLADASRARSGARIIAVTGSVGKTGTKQALALALGASGQCHASPASFNNHWGVPFSLANLPAGAAYGVFEIGMNHAGEIAPLARLVRPHVAIITTVAAVHLEFFPSVEAIADAKAEIFEGLESGGAAILNRDNEHYERLARAARARSARIVSFGTAARADAHLIDARIEEDGTAVEAEILGEHLTYRLGAPGRHLVMNSLAVLAAAKVAGADLKKGAAALARWLPSAGRGARAALRVGTGTAVLVDESYNANPASMRAALALLGDARPGSGGRRIAVLGDMLELGEGGPREHAALSGAVVEAGADLVFACGPLMRRLYDALPSAMRGAWRAGADELEDSVADALRPGDVVMVKASNGSRLGPLVEALKRRFASAARED